MRILRIGTIIFSTLIAVGISLVNQPARHENFTDAQPTLFYTGITPTLIEWKDSHNILVEIEEDLFVYNIESRTRIQKTSSEDQLSCETHIHTISHPEQIATEITIHDKNTSKAHLSSPLTLQPVNCANPLFLIPPPPLLATDLYIWYFNGKNTHPLHIQPENKPIQQVRVYDSYIAVQKGTTIRVLSTKDASFLSSFEIPTIDTAWDIINAATIAFLDNNTLNITHSETSQTIELPPTGETFQYLLHSPDHTSFALVSSSHELWILRI